MWLRRWVVGLMLGGGGVATAQAPPSDSSVSVASQPAVSPKAPPGPWLTDVRVMGPHADWNGVFPRDADLPSLVSNGDDHPRVASRQTAYAARNTLSHALPEWWQSVPVMRHWLFVPTVHEAQLHADAASLQTWFRDQGWLDCTVRLQLEPDEGPWGRWLERRAPTWTRRATFVVDIGERWTVRDVVLEGLGDLPRPLRREVRAAVSVVPGPFDEQSRAATEQAISDVLTRHGYPYPYVSSVLVPHDDDRTLALVFDLDPGIRAHVSGVVVEGLSRLDRERIRARIAPNVTVGESWNADKLTRIESTLSRVPSFATVEARPGAVDAEGGVEVRVRVKEADGGGWSPLVGIASESTFFAAEVGGAYRANRVGQGMAAFSSETSVGIRSYPVLFGPDAFVGNWGPVAREHLRSEVWVAPVAGVSVFLEANGDLEAVRANNLLTLALRPGVQWHATRRLSLWLAPEVAYWKSFPWSRQLELWEPWFQATTHSRADTMADYARPLFRTTAVGGLFHAGLDWTRVDRPLLPTKGGDVHVDLVPYGVADGDPFFRAEFAARVFVPISGPRWVLAPRVGAGWMQFHDADAAPIPQLRFLLGGGRTLRGVSNSLANPPGWDGGPNDLRIGGNVLAVSSLELRYALRPRLHLLGFTDVGRTWESLVDHVDASTGRLVPGVHLNTVLPAAGVGTALPTPIGRVVLAWAVRLTKDAEMAVPPPPSTFHFSLVQSL